jgi:peptide/nickel transport system substrate-binding protein
MRGYERSRRLRRGVAALAAVSLVLVACGGSDDDDASGAAPTPDATAGAAATGTADPADEGGTGGTLEIAMSAGNIPFTGTAPNEGYEGYRFVGNNLYDGLTRLNLEQAETLPTPQPALAESWDVSADQLTWTFHLRQGITFHDGTPFNADAVIFNFDRSSKPESQYYSAADAASMALYFLHIKEYAKVDDSTITITTDQPYAFLLYDLLTIFFASPAAVQQYGNEGYNQHATGTGPFKVVKYVDGEVLEMERNPDYWRGAAKLDRIILHPQSEPAARLASLQSGDVNWAEVPSPDALEQLEAEGYVVSMVDNHPGAIMPMMNMFRPPLTDLKVRQALNYAIDREGTNALINFTGNPASQYVYEGHPHFDPNYTGASYDPEKAKQLLAEAGYGPGGKQLSLKFAYTTGGSGNMFPPTMMEKIQADFAAVGVQTELIPMEWNSLITVIFEGLENPKNADIDILWSSPAAGMLPTGYSFSHLCTFAGGLPNPAGYCNPEVDELYNQAAASFDQEAQDALLRKMQTTALDDAPFLVWMQDRNLRVLDPSVKGFIQPQSWWIDFTTIWVDEG